MKKILGTIALAAVLTFAGAGSAVAASANDGSDVTFFHIDLDNLLVDHPEIETGEGYQNIVPLGGAIELDPSVVNEYGELDRSHLARIHPDYFDLDEEVGVHYMTDEEMAVLLELDDISFIGEDHVLGGGEAYVDIAPIMGDLEIEAIAEVLEEEAAEDHGNVVLVVAAIGGVVVITGVLLVVVNKKSKA